jgi:hypothetical protein
LPSQYTDSKIHEVVPNTQYIIKKIVPWKTHIADDGTNWCPEHIGTIQMKDTQESPMAQVSEH